MAAFLGRRARGGAGEVRQAGEIALLENERVGFLVGQHVLPELGAEARQPLVDRRQPVLRRFLQRAARAHEAGVVAVEHARLLGRKAEAVAPAVKLGDAGIKRAVQIDRVVVAREQRRDFALHRLDGVGRIGAGQHEEHVGDPVERPAGALHRDNGVVEARRRGVGCDRVDLGAVAAERRIEGRAELLGLDGAEGRQAESAGPVGKQRIGRGLSGGYVCHRSYLGRRLAIYQAGRQRRKGLR